MPQGFFTCDSMDGARKSSMSIPSSIHRFRTVQRTAGVLTIRHRALVPPSASGPELFVT
jgi:hypothetical protein